MPTKVKTLIITGYGLNCEKETACAFEIAGADTTMCHLHDLLARPNYLAEFHILALIGGFSFGDHLGAGTVLANRLKYQLKDELLAFIRAGKLILGICNGFQTLIRLGLLPANDDYFNQTAGLAVNDSGVFRDDWVTLTGNPDSACVFTKGIDQISLPIRHGEGKFVTDNDQTLARLEELNLVALRYAHPETGTPASEFPHNPNGSRNAIAGICDPTGQVFGMMPHPEAYLSPYNHPDWSRQKINGALPQSGAGTIIFKNAVDFATENLI